MLLGTEGVFTFRQLLRFSIICELCSSRRIMQNSFYAAVNHVTYLSGNKYELQSSHVIEKRYKTHTVNELFDDNKFVTNVNNILFTRIFFFYQNY